MMENKEQMNSVRKHADRYKMINKWAEMTKEETEIYKKSEIYKQRVKDLNLEKESLQTKIAELKSNLKEVKETFTERYEKGYLGLFDNVDMTGEELEELMDITVYIGKLIGKIEEKTEQLSKIEFELKQLTKK